MTLSHQIHQPLKKWLPGSMLNIVPGYALNVETDGAPTNSLSNTFGEYEKAQQDDIVNHFCYLVAFKSYTIKKVISSSNSYFL